MGRVAVLLAVLAAPVQALAEPVPADWALAARIGSIRVTPGPRLLISGNDPAYLDEAAGWPRVSALVEDGARRLAAGLAGPRALALGIEVEDFFAVSGREGDVYAITLRYRLQDPAGPGLAESAPRLIERPLAGMEVAPASLAHAIGRDAAAWVAALGCTPAACPVPAVEAAPVAAAPADPAPVAARAAAPVPAEPLRVAEATARGPVAAPAPAAELPVAEPPSALAPIAAARPPVRPGAGVAPDGPAPAASPVPLPLPRPGLPAAVAEAPAPEEVRLAALESLMSLERRAAPAAFRVAAAAAVPVTVAAAPAAPVEPEPAVLVAAEPEAEAPADPRLARADRPPPRPFLLRPTLVAARETSASLPTLDRAAWIGSTDARPDPGTRPGLWFATSMVTAEVSGWVTDEASGATVSARLVPQGGEALAPATLSRRAAEALGLVPGQYATVSVYLPREEVSRAGPVPDTLPLPSERTP